MKRHKYFREQKYKQKLEAKYYTYGGAWYSGVYFITAEPDPRSIRESRTLYELYPHLDPKEVDRAQGKNYYRYYHRPEIKYSIKKHEHGRSGMKNTLKKRSKDRFRTICKRYPEVPFWNSADKKFCDRWHFD